MDEGKNFTDNMEIDVAPACNKNIDNLSLDAFNIAKDLDLEKECFMLLRKKKDNSIEFMVSGKSGILRKTLTQALMKKPDLIPVIMETAMDMIAYKNNLEAKENERSRD